MSRPNPFRIIRPIEGGRFCIDLGELELFMESRREINRIDLSSVDIYEDGKKIEVSESDIEQFEFTGLCNIDFYNMRWWETAVDSEVEDDA